LALAAITLVGGCFSSNPEDIQAFVKPFEVNVTAENYVLQPPDEIEIQCSQVPEVHLQRQRIRPDGKVSFETLGEIEVAGKTPSEVAEIIRQQVEEFYRLPEDDQVHPVDVRLVAYASKRIYVLGQVYRPGPQVYTGRDSVLTAVAGANPLTTAWEQRIQVIRPSRQEDIPPRIFEVDYEQMIVHGDISKDVLLEEGDIVYVPPTVLAAVAMVLEEFLTPVARAFYGAYLVQNPPSTAEGGYRPYGGTYR
jgi:polysaccharide export outer membrane protein